MFLVSRFTSFYLVYSTTNFCSYFYFWKEIQPVHPKGDHSWVFIGRTSAEAEAETPILWPPDAKRKTVKSLSYVRLFATPWTVAYQAPPSMGYSRQEYWSGLPIPSLGDLPDSIFPSIWSFQMSQFLALGGQIIGVSALASVLLMNAQD